MHGPLQNLESLAQLMEQQLSIQQQRGAKRNSTSPGEEVRRISTSHGVGQLDRLIPLSARNATQERRVPTQLGAPTQDSEPW